MLVMDEAIILSINKEKIMNIKMFNNSNLNIDMVMPFFEETYETGKIHPELEDIFTVEFLYNVNPDGSARMVIDVL